MAKRICVEHDSTGTHRAGVCLQAVLDSTQSRATNDVVVWGTVVLAP